MYRPPPASNASTNLTNSSINLSISKAAALVSDMKYDKLLIKGDFNYPLITWTSDGGMLSKSDPISEKFLDNINSNYLTQHVLGPTFGSNQLDLIITNDPAISTRMY